MIPLSYVSEVKWIEFRDGFRSDDWIVAPCHDSNGNVIMYRASNVSSHYWSTLAQAKRYAEIRIYSARILKDLVHQLEKTSQEIQVCFDKTQ